MDEQHEGYPDALRRMGHRRIQWRKRTDLASAIVTKYESENYESLIL
jgi:hypothetical protein